MSKINLTEEFVKEITTGRRPRHIQEIIDVADEEDISAAYIDAMDRLDSQRKILSGLYVKEFISIDKNHNLLFSSDVPSDRTLREIANQFLFFSKLLDIPCENILFIKVEGDSMINSNISSGDIIIANKLSSVESNNIIIAQIYDSFYVKRYKVIDNKE